MRDGHKNFTSTARACHRVIGFAGGFSLFINVLQLTVPLFMMQLLDRVLVGKSYETLGWLTLLAVFALISMAALEMVRTSITAGAGTWFERKLGKEAFTWDIKGALSGKSRGTEMLDDLSTIRSFLASNSLNALFDAPWMPIYLALLFLLHPTLGWIATSGAAILLVFAVVGELWTRVAAQRAALAGQSSAADSMAVQRNAETAHALGMMENLAHRWFQRNDLGLSLSARVTARTSRLQAASKLTRMLVQIAVLGAGTVLVIAEEITPGVMIAGSIVMARALSPVEQAIGSWKNMVLARSAYGRLRSFFRTASGEEETMELPAPKGHLSLETVSYFFPKTDEPTLRDISLTCEPGDALAVVGPSGSGKTTLIRLVLGIHHATRGRVRLDGADITQWDRSALGPHLGYLPQNVELFAGSVKENIARMASNFDPEAVIAAAKAAGIHEKILTLPQGYDTQILADGANLSGGECQLVGLARALYGAPRFIVLDEPNANLDGEGEELLARAIAQLRRSGASVIVISHRPSVLRVTNKVLVLRKGCVEMFGPTDQVVARMTRKRAGANEKKVHGQEAQSDQALGMTPSQAVGINGGQS